MEAFFGHSVKLRFLALRLIPTKFAEVVPFFIFSFLPHIFLVIDCQSKVSHIICQNVAEFLLNFGQFFSESGFFQNAALKVGGLPEVSTLRPFS